MANDEGKKEDSRIERMANSAILVLTARIMSVIGPAVAIGMFGWFFGNINDLNIAVTKLTERIDGAIVLRMNYADQSISAINSRIDRLEQAYYNSKAK